MNLETCDLWDIWSEAWEDITTYLQTFYFWHLTSNPRDLFSTFSQLSQPFPSFFLSFFSTFFSTFSPLFLKIFSTFYQLFPNFFSSCDLWHLRHWLQYWQLRTWNHDKISYLTINCDTGQHSQFLRCFQLWFFSLGPDHHHKLKDMAPNNWNIPDNIHYRQYRR